jgi:hypothetical protein
VPYVPVRRAVRSASRCRSRATWTSFQVLPRGLRISRSFNLCIDATLHLLERMLGAEVASETARILEYTTARSANQRAWAFASRPAAET